MPELPDGRVRSMRIRVVAVLCATALVMAFVFWPGLYRYGYLGPGDNAVPMRTNRITGKTFLLIGTNWRQIGGDSASTPLEVPSDVLADLDGRAQFIGNDFVVDVYNGSTWTISEIDFKVHPIQEDRACALSADSTDPVKQFLDEKLGLWTRRFREQLILQPLRPLSTRAVRIDVGALPLHNLKACWEIVRALGNRTP